MMSWRYGERGFALPLTLFIVAMVTIILSAALVETRVDRRIAESAADQMNVVALAQSGLQTYLGTTNFDACSRAIRPHDGDSVRINLPGGYANVVARVVRAPASDTLAPWTYAVRSTGVSILPTQGADPQASRTVAQFAGWNSGWMDGIGTFVAANGLNRDYGGTVTVDGRDQNSCAPNDASLFVAGSLPDVSGSTFHLYGAAPVSGYSSSGAAYATNIDWSATTGSGLQPDYNYVRTWDPSSPVSRVIGDATLGSSGNWTYGWGLLIVTGDLTIIGSNTYWYGVVLVGGRIRFTADNQNFYGAVVSGLNAQLGTSVSQGHIGGTNLVITYSSTYVRLGLRSLTGFGPMSNTLVENWATY
jgi:hypothetical protein